MTTNSEYNRLVDNYLNGDLSGSEKEAFENQLSSDPALQSELNHQSEIIEGIESFRKTELKTRLAAINLNPTVLGLLSHSAAIKTAVTVATITIIGTGIYLYNNYKSLPLLQKVDAINEYALGNTELPVITAEIESIEVIENKDIPTPIVRKAKSKTVEKVIKEALTENTLDYNVPTSPNTSEANIDSNMEGITENTNGLEELAEVGSFEKVDVENIIDKKYKFHYQYTNGKLYLYGEFDKSPYEIIEVNARRDKRLFFYYQDNYYKIEKNNSDITAFKAISDTELIEELNIMKLKQK